MGNLDLELKNLELEDCIDVLSRRNKRSDAFIDFEINPDDPRESKIIANRPGLELFARDLLKESELFHAEHVQNQEFEVHANLGKWFKGKSKVRYQSIYFKEINKFQGSLEEYEKQAFWSGLFNSLKMYLLLAVYFLAVIGLGAVISYIVRG